MPDRPFTFSYMMYCLHEMASKSKKKYVEWTECGSKIVIKNRAGFVRAMGMKRNKLRIADFLNKLGRNGFIDEGSVFVPVLRHPWFVKGRRDLLKNFTYRNEFCLTLGIDAPEEKPYKSRDKSDKLLLELFDLSMRLFDLHSACLDLSASVKDVFRSINTEANLHMTKKRGK